MTQFLNGKVILHQGDSRDVLKTLPDNSIDSICTDPPYALVSIVKRFGKPGSAPAKGNEAYQRASRGFMGKQWDTGEVAFDPGFWEECLRVLKPGGHLISFGGTRTYHRMACAIEDAGFEIRDMMQWLYGSGFPKSHAVGEGWGTALKPANEPITLARKPLSEKTVAANVLRWGTGAINIDGCRVELTDGDDPRLGGKGEWGTTKMAKNVYEGGYSGTTVTSSELGRFPANVITDGSDEVVGYFPSSGGQKGRVDGQTSGNAIYGKQGPRKLAEPRNDSGSAARFFYGAQYGDNEWLDRNLNLSLANIVENSSYQQNGFVVSALEAAVNSVFPEGIVCENHFPVHFTNATPKELRILHDAVMRAIHILEKRFWQGLPLENLIELGNRVRCVVQQKPTGIMTIMISHWKLDGCVDHVTFCIMSKKLEHGEAAFHKRMFYWPKANKKDRAGSKHPTVKPIKLLRYLTRLITPPGGTVLDPFAGSGTTGEAAYIEGFKTIMIEREEEYYNDITQRILALDNLIDRTPDENSQADPELQQ